MYFPKNKIKTGFNSNGDLKIKSSDKAYFGPYFKTYTGKFYAGDTPNYSNLVELLPNTIPVVDGVANDIEDSDTRFEGGINGEYSDLLNIKLGDPTPTPPKQFKSYPTPEQYRLGEYIRYYAKKTNNFIYIEISKETYNRLKSEDPTLLWPLYDCIYMNYSLSNKKLNLQYAQKLEKEKGWYGFSTYLGLAT
jgi:hypothetical protein